MIGNSTTGMNVSNTPKNRATRHPAIIKAKLISCSG
jgi:hypothetical protein